MRKTIIGVGCLSLVLGLSACQEQQKEVTLETVEDKASYGAGYNLGRGFQAQQVGLNVDALAQGVRDAMAEVESKISNEDMQAAFQALREKQQERLDAQKGDNLEKANQFLAENAKKENIQVTDSGLQYEVIKSGEGKTPELTDVVRTHYHGSLIDGTVFDSSVDRGQPAEFPVNRVIAGWTEALQLMKAGDKWKLYIKPELAYGDRSPSPKIPANSALIFEIELLEVMEQAAPEATDPHGAHGGVHGAASEG